MTLAQRIVQLAEVTDAPSAFVSHLEQAFLGRGVALESDAAPFDALLQETFGRYAAIRENTRVALEGVQAWQTQLEQLHAASREQMGRLNRIKAALDGSVRRLEDSTRALGLGKPGHKQDVWN